METTDSQDLISHEKSGYVARTSHSEYPTSRALKVAGFLLLISAIIIIVLAVRVGTIHKNRCDSTTTTPTNSPSYAFAMNDALDPSINPCDDFYQFACGGWIKNTSLPDDAVRWARSFSVISEENEKLLRTVLEEDWPIIGPVYRSCMNMTTLNLLESTPLSPYLSLIQNSTTTQSFFAYAGQILRRLGVSLLFQVNVEVDADKPNRYILSVAQGGLSLGSPSYYLRENASILVAYKSHISKMLQLIGEPAAQADSEADIIVAFEKQIANFTVLPAVLRDPYAVYNLKSLTDLNASTSHLYWYDFLSNMGFNIPDGLQLNIQVPSFISALNQLVSQSPLSTLTTHGKWRILTGYANYLSQPIVDEHFAFFGKIMRGQHSPLPRWKFCVNTVDRYIGELLGHHYVSLAFPPSTKQQAEQLILQIKSAFSTSLDTYNWMDDQTRQQAKTKLDLMTDLIGHPNKYIDYSSVNVDSSFFSNVINFHQFGWAILLERTHIKVDKTIWQMTPPTVNAYYDPTYNTINFPAGILRPIFFDASYPLAMNFAGIGMVMGHELSHGFDDEGSQYDGTGKLNNWWTKNVRDAFDRETYCMENQYSKFKVADNLFVNGNLTLGENIADNGGLTLAYKALKTTSYKNDPLPNLSNFPNLDHDKLFFLAFAQSWCSVISKEYSEYLVLVDPHSPAFARVNGPISNSEDFSKVYGCPVNSNMNPKQKCQIW